MVYGASCTNGQLTLPSNANLEIIGLSATVLAAETSNTKVMVYRMPSG